MVEGGYDGIYKESWKKQSTSWSNGQIVHLPKPSILATNNVTASVAYIDLIFITKRPSVRHPPPAPNPLIRIRRSFPFPNGRAREPFREALLIMPRTWLLARWRWGGDRTSRHVKEVRNQFLDHVQCSILVQLANQVRISMITISHKVDHTRSQSADLTQYRLLI